MPFLAWIYLWWLSRGLRVYNHEKNEQISDELLFSYSFICRFIHSFIKHFLRACHLLGALLVMGIQNWKRSASVLILRSFTAWVTVWEIVLSCWREDLYMTWWLLTGLQFTLLIYHRCSSESFPLLSLFSHSSFFTASTWYRLLFHEKGAFHW